MDNMVGDYVSKKAIIILMAILCCCTIAACSFESDVSSEYNPSFWGSVDNDFAKDTMRTVVTCLIEKDTSKLSEMFSKTLLDENSLLERKIILISDLLTTDVLSYGEISCEIKSSSFEKNHYTFKSIRVVLEDIFVNDQEDYYLELWYTLVDENNPNNIGISKLILRDNQGIPIVIVP